jgi:hypothetical protein
MAVVPLGLAVVLLDPQASQDPPAMGGGAPVAVVAMATWRGTLAGVATVRRLTEGPQLLPLVLKALPVLVLAATP